MDCTENGECQVAPLVNLTTKTFEHTEKNALEDYVQSTLDAPTDKLMTTEVATVKDNCISYTSDAADE